MWTASALLTFDGNVDIQTDSYTMKWDQQGDKAVILYIAGGYKSDIL